HAPAAHKEWSGTLHGHLHIPCVWDDEGNMNVVMISFSLRRHRRGEPSSFHALGTPKHAIASLQTNDLPMRF
ncbi:MAG TPA: hypothetical protein PKA51_13165, partial [Kiritimatiellia bacterium]|nr:hypothetical protein [Kiritimatiellia bacterium]